MEQNNKVKVFKFLFNGKRFFEGSAIIKEVINQGSGFCFAKIAFDFAPDCVFIRTIYSHEQ